jgi:hypothetical protein
MGYRGGAVAFNFKTSSSGQRLFFPWGPWGQGYVLPSEREYERLRRDFGAYRLFLLLVAFPLSRLPWLIVLALLTLLSAAYAVWVRRRVAGFEPAAERLFMRESYTSAALAYGVGLLWFMEVAAIGTVGLCLFLLHVDPKPVFFIGIILFGLGAAVTAYMLVLRRHALNQSHKSDA